MLNSQKLQTKKIEPRFSNGSILSGVILISTSIVWPRYGTLNVFGVGINPLQVAILIFVISLSLSWANIVGCIKNIKTRGGVFTVLCALAWILWRFGSSYLGEEPGWSLYIVVREVVINVPIFFATLVIVSGVAGQSRIRRVIVLCSAWVVLVSFWEFMTRQTFIGMSGLSFIGDSTILNSLSQPRFRGSMHRLQSVFFHPIVFSQYIVWATPYMLGAKNSQSGIYYKIFSISVLLMMPLVVYGTDARSGIGGIAVSMIVYVIIRAFQKMRVTKIAAWMLILWGVILASFFYFFSASLVETLISGGSTIEAESTSIRLSMIEKGRAELAMRPISGFGDGRSAYHVGGFGTVDGGGYSIDSLYLSLALDGGLVGIALFLCLWGYVTTSSFNNSLRTPEAEILAENTAAIAGVLVVFSVLSVTDNMSLLYISAGIFVATLRK